MSAADIVRAHGHSLERSNDDASIATKSPMTHAAAHALVADLRAAGHEASDCPDQDDPSLAWVYVTLAS